jgi:hypothetical protein
VPEPCLIILPRPRPSRRWSVTTTPSGRWSDDAYRICADQYGYDRTPLEARVPMLNGDQDHIFPLQTAQQPLFQGLATPRAD